MVAYISGICSKEITGMNVESINISDEIGCIDWDEQDISVNSKEGEFIARLKGIYFDDEYANGKGKVLEGKSAYIDFNIYSVNDMLVDITIGEGKPGSIPEEKNEDLAKSIKIIDIFFRDDELDYVLEARENE